MPEPAQGNSVTNTFQAPFQLPAGATEVVLVRHGSVAFTGGGLAGGGADPPLTDTGRAQAHAVVHALVGTSFQGLVSSPLRRVVETAAPLAAATGISSVAFEELREVGLGEWETTLSQRIAERDPVAARLFAEQRWDVIPGAEPMPDFEARVREGLDRLITEAGGGRVVAVVHGGVIAEALRRITGSRGFAFLGAENGSISRVIHGVDGT
jgi:2,3-bisphosphoglycerate-dependent phosphoglycerate mutase